MTGRVAASTGTPRPTFATAAMATAAPSPPAVQASVRAESLPTTFSVYSPMSLCTDTLNMAAPYAGSQDVSSMPKYTAAAMMMPPPAMVEMALAI